MAKKQHSIEKRWYTKQEAVIYLGKSERQIDKLRSAGKLTAMVNSQKGKNEVYFDKEKLDEYVTRNFKEDFSIALKK